MEPYLGPKDHVQLQHAAAVLGRFAGIRPRTIIVGVAKQKAGVAAHVHLPSYRDNEVFIELESWVTRCPAWAVGVLAHEITHVYLHENSISCRTTPYEDEVLTDIGAVFLGFGKLVLNAVYDVAEPLEAGYLNSAQLAFVYFFVCRMRKMSQSEIETGLTQKAIEAVRGSLARFGRLCSEVETSVALLEEHAWKVREKLDVLERYLVFCSEGVVRNLNSFLDRSHNPLLQLGDLRKDSEDSNVHDPAMRMINTALMHLQIEKISDAMSECEAEITFFRAVLVSATKDLDQLKPTVDAYNYRPCRKCGNRLKLQARMEPAQVRCPKCGYLFIGDARPVAPISCARGVEDAVQPASIRKSSASKNGGNWLSRSIRKLFAL
jgi:hypothetical protein